jgi:glycosyltransferase involved in cell wall biosynthesis
MWLPLSIVVADCFSTDATLEIARAHGARVIQREWVNHAIQFNWALDPTRCGYRLGAAFDADEYLTPELISEIQACSAEDIGPEIDGMYCGRRMTFQGRLIRHGGVFPIRVLRLFRYGRGECENRWMDEHIKVAGPTMDFRGETDRRQPQFADLVDGQAQQVRQPRSGGFAQPGIWLHASRFGSPVVGGSQAGFKRWLKERVYARLPGGFRAFAYFFYRYVIRLGFLDGQAGYGVPLPAGILVSLSGGCQGGGGQAVYA